MLQDMLPDSHRVYSFDFVFAKLEKDGLLEWNHCLQVAFFTGMVSNTNVYWDGIEAEIQI